MIDGSPRVGRANEDDFRNADLFIVRIEYHARDVAGWMNSGRLYQDIGRRTEGLAVDWLVDHDERLRFHWILADHSLGFSRSANAVGLSKTSVRWRHGLNQMNQNRFIAL